MSTKYRTLVNSNPVNAIVSYAISQGWTIPSASTINAMNTFITSLQISGIWDKYDIFYNFRYNNTALANFSRINWKNPGSYTLSSIGSFNYTVEGYENGVDGTGLNTGFFPSINGVNFQLNNANMTFAQGGSQFSSALITWAIINNEGDWGNSSLRTLIGSAGPPPVVIISARLNTSTGSDGGNITAAGIPLPANAISVVTRSNSSQTSVFHNGSLVSSNNASNSTSIHNSSVKINYTTYDNFPSVNAIIKMAALGGSLTSTDVSNLQTYYSVFYTALNNTVSNIIQLSSFTPTPATISSRVSVSAVSDTITISGVMNGTWAIEMTYQIVPDTGYEAWVYSVTPSGPDPYGAIKLIDVYGTNSKTVENTDLFQSPGLVTDNGTYNFTIIGSLGFRYKIRFNFDLYQIVGSTYILVDSYTSPYTSIQEIV